MRVIFSCLLIVFSLNASMFENYPIERSIHIKSNFIKNISDANAVIKKGDFERFTNYKHGIKSTIDHVEKSDISKSEKIDLKNDLRKYADIINKIYIKLHKDAPEFNKHYKNSIKGLKKFNRKLSNIGYKPLLKLWYELSKTKGKFIKKPSRKLQKKFDEDYNLMIVNITELYLDDKDEKVLFEYLKNYKTHFKEVSMAYESIGFQNIKILKPLSYKIKAKMEFISPIKL